MADVKDLAEQLVNLTIKEANELAKVLEEEYDIKPAAAAVAVAGPVGGGEAGGAAGTNDAGLTDGKRRSCYKLSNP